MSFEWQTEEDYSWDEEPEAPEPPQPQRRRWPWLVLVAVLLVGAAVFLLYRQLNQRIEIATEDVADDLIASYAVLQQAAQNKDNNLFSSLLSGREPEWSLAQQDNIAGGLLFDRPGFNLEWQPGLVETAVLSHTLSPDLTAAELTTVQKYSLDIGNGLTETVKLERLDVYRLGEDRWLYAPPEREFWGVRRRLEGQLLSVRYPERDEEIVHRLAADLEAKLVQLCTVSGYTCPPEARVRLIFSPEPDSLTQATFLDALTQDREADGAIWSGEQAIVLPTPTLVGLPQDEVGYRAIFRGYARQMLTPAINDLIGWHCCQNVPYYRAVVTYQLYELGVGVWPLAANAASPTAITFSNDFHLGHGALFWNGPFPEIPTDFALTPAPYVVVDFLVNELHISAREITTFIITSDEILFDQWLVDLTGPPWTQATLNDAFRAYVARWQVEPEARPQPDAGLMLLCQNELRSEQGLYYFDYSLEVPQLLQAIEGDDLFFFVGLPDGSGVAVASRNGDDRPETYLLHDDKRTEVTWNRVVGILSRPPLAIPTTTDPNGRYLLWTVMPQFATDTFYALTDLAACQEGANCEAIPLGGYPVWSPTSEQLITLTVTNPWWSEGLSNGLMLLRDAPTAEAINSPGFGASVFWLNQTEFGYLNQFQNGLHQLVIADTELSRPQTLLTNDSLPAFFSADERPNSLTLEFVQPLPTDPRILVIMVKENFNQASEPAMGHLFWYDRTADSVRLRVSLPAWAESEQRGYRFSPDGRFLLLTYPNPEDTTVELFLADANGPRIFNYHLLGDTPFPRHFYASWSPDSEWLVMPELGYIRLWHNGRDEQLLSFENLNCTNAAWVARMEP